MSKEHVVQQLSTLNEVMPKIQTLNIFQVLLWDGERGWDGVDCPGIHNPDLLIYSVNSCGWRGEGVVFSYNGLNMTLVTETELLVYTKCFDLYCRLGVGYYIKYIVTSPHPSTHTHTETESCLQLLKICTDKITSVCECDYKDLLLLFTGAVCSY